MQPADAQPPLNPYTSPVADTSPPPESLSQDIDQRQADPLGLVLWSGGCLLVIVAIVWLVG